MDYNSWLSIDLDRLEWEWVEQPKRYRLAAKRLTEAREALDTVKNTMSVVEAEVELEIRSHPKKYKLKEPVREGAVKLQIPLHQRIQKQSRLVIKAKYRVGILEGLVEGLQHKKRALEKLVDLFGMDYFAKPLAKTADDREHFGEARKRALRRKGKVNADG